MKLGILGGTFDPPHNGHLMLAEQTRLYLNLAKVIFIPAGQPWAKASLPVSPAKHRREMARLAIQGCPYFSLSDIEIKRPGPSYTWETLEELKKIYPDDELYFILGWDNLKALPSWHKPERIIAAAGLAAAPRAGFVRPEMPQIEAVLPGISSKTVIMPDPRVDISASDIRLRVKRGLPIEDLVPQPVAAYIRRNGLYLDG